MSPVPTVETARLILRDRVPSDFPAYAAMWADPVVTRHFGAPVAEEDAWTKFARMPGFWALCGYGFWIVEEKETGRLVGEAGTADFRRGVEPGLGGRPECGWVLASSVHGKGYAREAMDAALAWAETNIAARRFCCVIDPGNAPSIRLADRLGFLFEQESRYRGKTVNVYGRAPR